MRRAGCRGCWLTARYWLGGTIASEPKDGGEHAAVSPQPGPGPPHAPRMSDKGPLEGVGDGGAGLPLLDRGGSCPFGVGTARQQGQFRPNRASHGSRAGRAPSRLAEAC
jgi:hypothetical protein